MCNVFISMQWHVQCFYFYAMTCEMFLFLCNDMCNVFISMQWHVKCFYFYAMTCEMFLFLCNDIWNVFISMQWHVKCFQSRSCPKQGKNNNKKQKKNKKVLVKNLFTQTNLMAFYAYWMLLSFKTSITCKRKSTLHRTAVSVVKQLSPDITRHFVGCHALMFRPDFTPFSNVSIFTLNKC